MSIHQRVQGVKYVSYVQLQDGTYHYIPEASAIHSSRATEHGMPTRPLVHTCSKRSSCCVWLMGLRVVVRKPCISCVFNIQQ